MITGIYKIENLINHKIYIGQSIYIEKRWFDHIHSKDEFAIHKAFKKYGIENFSFQIVEQCDIDKLDEKENYWINFYQSLVPNGYNMIQGGTNGAGFAKGKKVLQYDLNGKFIKEWKSIKEASRILKIDNSCISKCCYHKRNKCGGYIWRFYEEVVKNGI